MSCMHACMHAFHDLKPRSLTRGLLMQHPRKLLVSPAASRCSLGTPLPSIQIRKKGFLNARAMHEQTIACCHADVIISNVCGHTYNQWAQGPAVAFMSAKSYSNITDSQFIDNACPVSPEYVNHGPPRPGGYVSISSCGEALIECEDVHVALQNVQFSRPNSCGRQCPPEVELAVRSLHADYSTLPCSAF
jgi:hypothetical protein